ncbi:MAG: type IV pilin protein [Litorivicinus sp.]
MVIRGFTLIELMITLAIVAVLATLAVPSYTQYVQEARRADAQIALVRLAQQQEQFHSLNANYATTLAALNAAAQSPEGFYSLSVSNPGCDTGYIGCFVVTATATGAQAADTACASLSLDQSGQRSASGGGDCWP